MVKLHLLCNKWSVGFLKHLDHQVVKIVNTWLFSWCLANEILPQFAHIDLH